MPTYVDHIRLVLESNDEGKTAHDFGQQAHSAMQSGDHKAAGMYHDLASTAHWKLSRKETDPFKKKYHENMQAHHDTMRDLHWSHNK